MILVIGSGVAGLSAALTAAAYGPVTLVSKDELAETNTRLAQGGIAAALADDDSPQLHAIDTLVAGAGLTLAAAARVLTEEGPDRVYDLIARGIEFDRDADGQLLAGLEAAHSRKRIWHANGDRTGAAVQAGLLAQLADSGIKTCSNLFLLDLIVSDGQVQGARFLAADGSQPIYNADAVILATGGAGQLHTYTTNPSVATGDGIAAAFRAGAALADLEFFQFHPTALAVPATLNGAPMPLISEAVRGAGAVLLDEQGQRFMPAWHPLAELAPRDQVARGIAAQMAKQQGRPVLLDATGIADLALKFPGITALCQSAGLDWTQQAVPVTPAAHSLMGGIRTDLHGRSSLPGLYAAGECACTGVHGANRLASNSLLEGMVFGRRAALAALGRPVIDNANETVVIPDVVNAMTPVPCTAINVTLPDRHQIRDLAWSALGLARDAVTLAAAEQQFALWACAGAQLPEAATRTERETANLALLGWLTARAALGREESRGAHARSDFPELDTQCTVRHLLVPVSSPSTARFLAKESLC